MDTDHHITDQIGSDQPYRVGVFALPGFALMSYSCTVEPLRAANLLSRKPLYEVVHFGSEPRTPSSGGAYVEPRYSVGDMPPLDLLLVVAGGDPFAFGNRATFRWLRHMARSCERVGGVSGGAVILAQAGLMKQRRMTVHWEHAEGLSDLLPDALIEKRLFVIDRDRVTCGGGIAPLDLMHALIASQHGRVFARLVSDWFLHTEIRAAAAPQRGGLAERIGSHSPHLLEAVSAMESHIADPLTLKQLALVADVSPRHLNRLFDATLDQSVMDYYRYMRLEVAQRLIKGSSMSIGEIADATGFSNTGHFSNAYRQRYNTRPLADRRNKGEHR